MEKLLMCRICLREEVQMQSIADTHLQEMYEYLTLIPFETKDNRPDEICDICCERLQNCYLLWKRCLQSEELFTRMISNNVQAPAKLEENPCPPTLTEIAVHVNIAVWNTDTDRAVMIDPQENVNDIDVGMEDSEYVFADIEDEPLEEEKMESEATLSDSQLSILYDNDLVLPVVLEGPSDATTSDRHEGHTVVNFKENEEIQTKMEELQNFIKLIDIYKTLRKGEIFKTNDKDNLYKEINYGETLAKKNIDKDISFGEISQDIDTYTRTRTGDKPYQCDVCNKSFNDKRLLSRHIRRHNDEKLYQCKSCNKFFSENSLITVHFRTPSGKRPYM